MQELINYKYNTILCIWHMPSGEYEEDQKQLTFRLSLSFFRRLGRLSAPKPLRILFFFFFFSFSLLDSPFFASFLRLVQDMRERVDN